MILAQSTYFPFGTSTQLLLLVAPWEGMIRSPPPLCLLPILAGHLCNHILITKQWDVIGGISAQNQVQPSGHLESGFKPWSNTAIWLSNPMSVQ